MSKAGQIPYEWPEIEQQIRRNVVAMANILELYGPNNSRELLDLFLGCDTSDIQTDNISDEHFAAIDVSNHGIHRLVKSAYTYAYQLDGAELTTSEDHYEVVGLLESSYTQVDIHGEPTPLYVKWDQPLRRVIETFNARWNLNNYESGLSVRELSLLANMTPQAVRNSLSKEGFKLELKVSGSNDEDNSFALPAGDALTWLSKRRGYLPNRPGIRISTESIVVAATEILSSRDLSFPDIADRLIKITMKSVSELSDASSKSASWLEHLLAGKAVDIDLHALVAVGRALNVDPAKFSGLAVQHLLSLELSAEEDLP